MSKFVRCTFTLPKSVSDDINTVAKGLHVSRSALVVNMLGDGVHDMASVVRQYRQLGETPEAALRLRGESVEKVKLLYGEFLDAVEKQDWGVDHGY